MTNYLLRRVLLAAVTLLLVTFVIYGLVRNMPGSAVDMEMAMSDPSVQIDEEDLKRLEKLYGLDKPWYQAYWTWVGNLVTGDLGQSFKHRRPVGTLLLERMGPTLTLAGLSLVLTYLLSVPIGLWSSANSGKPVERFSAVLLYMLYSFPAFVAALFLQLVFAVWLDGTMFELPLIGIKSDGYESLSFFGKAWDRTLHLILPVTCYSYGSLAYYSRFIKANMEEVLREDYIRTARAKGVDRSTVIRVHAFRNMMIPFVTLVGLTLPVLVSGSVVLETVFNWPGMGTLLFEGVTQRDYPTIMGVALVYSVLTLVGQLLADVLYAWLDPRIKYT